MAETGPIQDTWSFESDYDFLHAHIFVTGAAEDHAQLATDPATTSILGVAITDPDSGQQVTVQFAGVTKIHAGGALTLFDIVTTDGSGRAAACTSGDVVLGQILQTAGADGDKVTMRIINTGARWPGVV